MEIKKFVVQIQLVVDGTDAAAVQKWAEELALKKSEPGTPNQNCGVIALAEIVKQKSKDFQKIVSIASGRRVPSVDAKV